MIEETISSNESLKVRSKETNPKLIRALLIVVLVSALISVLLNVTQLVFIYRVLHNLSEGGSVMLKLDGLAKSVDGMTVLIDENGKLRNDVSGISTNINTLTGMVRDLNGTSDTLTANPNMVNTVFHLRFVCTEANSGNPVSSCPIQLKVLSAEPAREFEIQGNNQEAISLPLRVRLSIAVQVSGYKPYASVFEFTETGAMQDFVIKLEK